LARAAHAAGWLRLSLTAAHKALQVSELPRDQYDYGWTYSQHQIVRRLRFFWTPIWGKTCDPNWSS
jgi:hypothetical protein